MRSRRLAYCRSCERETAQQWAGAENGNRPQTLYYSCEDCGLILITYADVLDADGLCLHVLDRYRRAAGIHDYGDVRSLDPEEAFLELRAALWKAYLDWDPRRGVRFRAYATWIIGRRLVDWIRDRQGRDGPKALAVSVSLDALVAAGSDSDGDPLGTLIGTWQGDPSQGRSPDFARLLVPRGGRDDREQPRADRTGGAGTSPRDAARAGHGGLDQVASAGASS